MSFIPSAQLTLHGSLEAGKGRVHPDGVFAGGGLGSIVELGDCITVEHQLCTCMCVHASSVRRGRETKWENKRNKYDSLFFCVWANTKPQALIPLLLCLLSHIFLPLQTTCLWRCHFQSATHAKLCGSGERRNERQWTKQECYKEAPNKTHQTSKYPVFSTTFFKLCEANTLISYY